MEGTLRHTLDIVYWPGITGQLKDYLSKCGICNSYRPKQCKEPLKPYDVPDVPQEMVRGYLFVLERQSFLIAVDYHSEYFEVQDMSSTTNTCVITVLKSWFSKHGIPMTLISDNGTPLNCENLKAFGVGWDFHQSLQVLITHKVLAVQKMLSRPVNVC